MLYSHGSKSTLFDISKVPKFVIYFTNLCLLQLIFLPQDDDEADTVGCCTLKVENVTLVSPNQLQVRDWIFWLFFFSVYLILVKGFLG